MTSGPVRKCAQHSKRREAYQFSVLQAISVNFGNLTAENEDAQRASKQEKDRGHDGKEVLLKREREVEVLTTAGDDGAESGVVAGWRRRIHGVTRRETVNDRST